MIYTPLDRIGQEVTVSCGTRQVFVGKWKPGFHQNIIQFAYHTERPITVRRQKDEQMLFQVEPWGRDD